MKKLNVFLFLLMAAPIYGQEIQWGSVNTGENISLLRVPGKVIPKEGALSIESARVQGRITNILKREGEIVHVGDPIFAINSAECVSLTEEKRVAQERGLDDLINASKAREAQLGLRVRPGQCEILATESGTIVKRQLELGAAFNVGDALATVVDVDNLNVELDIPERDLTFVKPDQAVELQLPSYPGQIFHAKVERLLPSIDPQTRTSKVRLIQVSLPKGITLDALVLAEIHINTNERILKVPTTALVFHQNKQYVVKKSDKASAAVPVEVVNETETESSVRPWNKDELKANDQIAVKGAIFVFNSLKNSVDKIQ